MKNTIGNNTSHKYNVALFLRFSRKIQDTIINGRICLESANPMIESIAVDNFQVVSRTAKEIAGKSILSLELNAKVTATELRAICADICQNALHKSITAILPWSDRHQNATHL